MARTAGSSPVPITADGLSVRRSADTSARLRRQKEKAAGVLKNFGMPRCQPDHPLPRQQHGAIRHQRNARRTDSGEGPEENRVVIRPC
jgi:hypothetical protein